MKNKLVTSVVIILLLMTANSVFGRAEYDIPKDISTITSSEETPAYGIVAHRVGQIVLAINNDGTFGDGFASSSIDFFTGDPVSSCEYPKGSRNQYLFAGAFWIGAVVGRDTLVSVAADGWSNVQEFKPLPAPFGNIIKRSSLYPDNDELFQGAISEEDYIMTYMDTSTTGIGNDFFGRPHSPLNIEVSQRSFAWSYPYAEDFVLFDLSVKNIGIETLEKVYMGLYIDGDVGSLANESSANRYIDDISGFIETIPTKFNSCDFIDTVNIAWLCDNDGDPTGNFFDAKSCPGVTGTRIVRTPADSLEVSFNWWVSAGNPERDYGPREKSGVGKLKEEFRDFKTGGLGTPEGDVNKYYIMRNREFDYDQPLIGSISQNDSLWLQPSQDLVAEWSQGLDTRYLLSFGPFNVNPGEELPISFAYVGGENLHHVPDNIDNLPSNPAAFYANLDFSDFGENAAWAAKVYDNPGVDTDDDGYAGKFRTCASDSALVFDTITTDPLLVDTTFDYTVVDTIYYEGDGVPDFQGAAPPPAPKFWVSPFEGGVKVRINGLNSETAKDNFSRIVDFEGYRIYLSRDDRASSYSMISSFDQENYNKYVWNPNKYPEAGYDLREIPFTLDQLRCLYGDSCNDMTFDPLFYNRSNPYFHPLYADSIFYFAPQDYNASDLGVNTMFTKIYPDQPYPTSIIPDSAEADELTDDGYLKYFEYEVTIDDILPTIPYYVNVTAFDFGNPASGVEALESSKTINAQEFYPLNTYDVVQANDDKVYVWPNPYRKDGGYQNEERRFEFAPSNASLNADRIRRIHFANLPPKCTIKIFTLDGDLVREIVHDTDANDPASMHEEWDLITRNTQLVVSGLYYFTVESDGKETQVGKFAIIM